PGRRGLTAAGRGEASPRCFASGVNAESDHLTADSRRFTNRSRRGRESNPRIAVLQTATLPLGYPAIARGARLSSAAKRCQRAAEMECWSNERGPLGDHSNYSIHSTSTL